MFIYVYSYLPYVLRLKHLVFQLDQGAKWVSKIIFFCFSLGCPYKCWPNAPQITRQFWIGFLGKKKIAAMSMLLIVLKHYSEHEKTTSSLVIIVRDLET